MEPKRRKFLKRLECAVSTEGRSFRAFTSELSDTTVKLTTRNVQTPGTFLSIIVNIPDGKPSNLRAVVKSAVKDPINAGKSSMVVEVIEFDHAFIEYLQALGGGERGPSPETFDYAESPAAPQEAAESAAAPETSAEPPASEPASAPAGAEGEDFAILACSHCGAKNKIPAERLDDNPVCARCKKSLYGLELPGAGPAQEAPAESAPQTVETIKCPSCGANNKIPSDKLHLGPKCGRCKAPLIAAADEPISVPAPEPAPAPEPPKAPLPHMKAGTFEMLTCPSCGAKNRIPNEKLSQSPKCGRCKADLFDAPKDWSKL